MADPAVTITINVRRGTAVTTAGTAPHEAVEQVPGTFEVDGITYTRPRRPYTGSIRPLFELIPDHHQCGCQHPGTTHHTYWYGTPEETT